MKEFRIGIIGCNRKRRAKAAWLAHQPQKGCFITAGADLQLDVLKDFQECFGSESFVSTGYRELLMQDIDAVFIMTPDYLHEEQAVAALEAGKTVYLEKPLALTLKGTDNILKTALKTGSKLFVGHNMRYFPAILKMKEIIDSGLIGIPKVCWCRHFVGYGNLAYFLDWHCEEKYANGLLLQKGSHDIDVIHWLMGSYTKSVSGMGMNAVYADCQHRPVGDSVPDLEGCNENPWPNNSKNWYNPAMDVEDHNMIMMQLENGTQACLMECFFTPNSERNYTIIGTHGRIENVGDIGNCEIHVWNKRGQRSEPDIIYKLKGDKKQHGGADPIIIDSFLAFARDGIIPNVNPVDARNAVAVGSLGHESMRNSCKPMELPSLALDIIEYFEKGQLK
jgi:predicted dehydrogenase